MNNSFVCLPKGLANKNLNVVQEMDCDICAQCGEHAYFDEGVSECCGAKAYDTDPDVDMER